MVTRDGKAHPTAHYVWYRIEFAVEAWIPILKGSDRQLEPLKPADLRRSAPPDSVFMTSQPELTAEREVGEHVFGGAHGRFFSIASQAAGRATHAQRVVGLQAATETTRRTISSAAKKLPARKSGATTGDVGRVSFVNPLDASTDATTEVE